MGRKSDLEWTDTPYNTGNKDDMEVVAIIGVIGFWIGFYAWVSGTDMRPRRRSQTHAS